MNLIVEKAPEIRLYTDLFPFLSRLGPRAERYVWLLTDVELNVGSVPFDEYPSRAHWVAARDLMRFVEEVRPQFVWAVLSAIPSGDAQAARNQECYPFADGNPSFWTGSPRPQHAFAEFEIVCWDSTLTLLIGADEEVAECFRNAYPGATDLDAENAQPTGG